MHKEQFIHQIADRLGGHVGNILTKAIYTDPGLVSEITEIRLRIGRPMAVKRTIEDCFLNYQGCPAGARQAYCITQEDLSGAMSRICQHSRYAFESDIKQGYVTIPGGHRVGLAGKMLPDGTLTDVSGMSVRIAKAILGASQKILPYVLRGRTDIYSTLIISPPGCGKTTILRDLTRNISNGVTNLHFTGLNVSVVDERAEIGACLRSIPTHDVGLRTDLYDGCPKDKGILMMLRAMAPDVIVLDELGGEGDLRAVYTAMHAGVRFIATMHGYGIDPASQRMDIKRMIEAQLFERYVVLDRSRGPGTVTGIYDAGGKNIYKSEGLR
ncbi:MAG: stage III sporulation protein AA [Clostridia bacterium]|nr:stage III sporulation protein AA [Clostridia bacterium]